MKILFVYQFCSLGGVESVLRNRLSGFYQKGIFPHVVFFEDVGGSKIFEGYRNIHYQDREGELLRMVEENGFDFIIPIDTPQIYQIMRRSGFRGILITEVHTNNLGTLQYLNQIGETKTRAIITPSEFERDLIHREINGFRKAAIPIYIVPNPVNVGIFKFKEPLNKTDKKVIGWVGRLEKQKNWRHFLEIARSLSRKRGDVHFILVGGYNVEGGVKKDFWTTVKDLGLVQNLKWVPNLQYDRMPGVYSLISASGGCLVTTSILEPFGMTVIEAMACRCPVVASRVGGFQEIIEDGKNGFLFEVNNTEEAVEKIERIIDDTPRRTTLIQNGYQIVNETYSPERVVDQYLGILNGLLGEL